MTKDTKREERLAAALRDNLRKRKVSRGGSDGGAVEQPVVPAIPPGSA